MATVEAMSDEVERLLKNSLAKHIMNGMGDVKNIGWYGAPVIVDTWTTCNDCN